MLKPLLTLLFFLAALSFAPVRGQDLDKRISVHYENKRLKEVLDGIAQKAAVTIIYSSSKELIATTVSIHAENKPLKAVLAELLAPFHLTCRLIGRQLVITRDAPAGGGPPVKQAGITIKGTVTNAGGDQLPGATVRLMGESSLAIAGENGEFSLTATGIPAVLQVSYIGYKSKEITQTDSARLTIVLTADRSELNEVTVVSTGYETLPAERATGSFAQPVKAEFAARVAPDVLSKLGGITSGLVFNANTSLAKNGLDINIRGRSTIFANDQPLIVVDNFPYSGNISTINPNDVESVTLLKDAAAASIWGVRAGNGVIVITTKKGRVNQPLSVVFNANITVFNKPDLNYNPNQLAASSYIGLEQYLFSKGYYDANLSNTTTYPVVSPVVELLAANRAGTLPAADLNARLDALRGLNVNDQLRTYFYQKATNQQYALNLSGGSAKASYYFSAGYDNDLAGLKGNANRRMTINARPTFYLLEDLELSAGIHFVQTDNTVDNTLSQVRSRVFPYTQVADAQGNPLPVSYSYRQSYIQSAPANGFLDWSYYPLKELGAAANTTRSTDIRLTGGLKYTFSKGLTGDIKYQYQKSDDQNRNYQSQQTYYTRNLINQFSILTAGKVTGYNLPLGGILGLSGANTLTHNVRAQLSYQAGWHDHALTALAGYELSQTTAESSSSSLYGYNDNLATFTDISPLTRFNTNPSGRGFLSSGLSINGTLARIRSSFANAAYTYKGRYILSGSARIDGTNYFGVATNQKNLPLWSAGGKWAIAKEDFYKLGWLPVLELRASYGYNGNLDQSVTGVTTFLYLSNAANTNLNYARISNMGNPDLRWEKTGIANLAIDFGTKNNSIYGSLDYYLKKETDLLGFKTFPSNTGISSLKGNYSDMTGHGFDLSLTTRNLNGLFKWSTSLQLSHATDKVTRYAVAPYAYQLIGTGTGVPQVGKPVFGVYGYQWGGLNPATGNPAGFVNGVKSEDYAAITNNTPVGDLVYAGPARPTFFGGINNRFTYKGWSVAVQLSYKLGYYINAPVFRNSVGSNGAAILQVNRDYNKRWQNPGDEKNTDVPSFIYPFSSARDNFYQYASVNIEKADHLRLQDMSISYDFNKSVYPKLPFTQLQLFLFANNIGILWRANHQGIDPDAVSGDNSAIPAPKSVSVGLKGNF